MSKTHKVSARKYDNVEKLTPHLYMALGKVIQYAKDIRFLK